MVTSLDNYIISGEVIVQSVNWKCFREFDDNNRKRPLPFGFFLSLFLIFKFLLLITFSVEISVAKCRRSNINEGAVVHTGQEGSRWLHGDRKKSALQKVKKKEKKKNRSHIVRPPAPAGYR